MEQERVLHGLDSCGFHDGIPNICEVTECPYRDNKTYCVHELAHDAGILISELLKAQEPMGPDIEGNVEYDGHGSWWHVCGACRQPIDKGDKFCRWCGRPVKWK